LLQIICGETASKLRTKVISGEKLDKSLDSFCNYIEKIAKTTVENKNVALLIDNSPKISPNFMLSLSEMPPDSRISNIWKQLIKESAYRSEIISAQSSFFMIKTLVYLMKNKISNRSIDAEKINEICDFINRNSQRANIELLNSVLDDTVGKYYSSIVLESMKLAGPNGKIKITDGKLDKLVVAKNSGFNFLCNPDPNIIIKNNGFWNRKDATVFVIEGIIESVSEINHVLSHASSGKSPVVIFCLGYSEEVISTILLNNDRRTFDIMICCPNTEVEASNDLSDICLVTGVPMHGYQTGNLSTSINIEEEFEIKTDEIEFTLESVKIKNPKRQFHAQSKCQELIKKIKGVSHENSYEDYIKKRISNLSLSQVEIRLPVVTSQEKVNMTSMLDSAIRISKSIVSYGVLDADKVIQKFPDLSFLAAGKVPSASFYVGLKLGYQLFSNLTKINCAIVCDD
jgi:hypothetical protein